MTRLDLYGEWLKIEESRDMKTSESRKEMLVVWTSVGAKQDAGINKNDFFFPFSCFLFRLVSKFHKVIYII